MRTGVVVGNPKPASRTYQAAVRLAELLTGRAPDLTIDLAEYGAGLLDWSDAATAGAVSDVIALDLLVVASPTYKASYTGLLKLFLDRFQADSLAGVVTIPLMLGAGPGHAMAPEVFLKPVLTELGALLPTRALYLLDSSYDDPAAYEPWLAAARAPVRAALAANTRPS
ncbi:NADPH-dependent FMN reductase [Catenulispora pinistramenti]|uniref:NADPH-dependent FMN reductase n=1 Tax=Catenulispora pinistramenti TaxID=2705254 RepID=UPI0034D64D29